MPVVLAARYRNQRRAEQRAQAEKDVGERGVRVHYPQLGGEEEGDVAEPGEGEGAVPAGEAAPAVVEDVVGGFGADFEGHEGVDRGVLGL